MTYGLAIHTASPDLGLAIGTTTGDCRAQVWPLGRDLSTQMHRQLAAFLPPQSWTDLAFLAVAKGPGGFTGTRIGVVTARALAQQLNIPLFAISTLAAWADMVIRDRGSQPDLDLTPLAIQMPAQRGEVFGAIYQPSAEGLQTLLSDAVMPIPEWEQTLAQWPTPYHLIPIEGGLGAAVTGVLSLAMQDWQRGQRPHWSAAIPFYGQHPVR